MSESSSIRPAELLKPRWFMQNGTKNGVATSDSTKRLVASYKFTLNDYVWYPDGSGQSAGNMLKSYIPNVPDEIKAPIKALADDLSIKNISDNTAKIIVHEFEPQADYQYYYSLYSKIFEGFNRYFSAPKPRRDAINKEISNIFGETQLTKDLGKALGISPSTAEDMIFGLPNAIYKTLITGQWIGRFEIPYYGEHFLHAKGDVGWHHRSATSVFDIGGGFTGRILESLGLQNINIAIRPLFRFSDGANGPPADALDVTFYLYNENIEGFAKNFNFLKCLVSGPFWVQSGILQRPSNLYNVVIPGRLNYYFCTLELKVDYVGKTRQLGEAASQLIGRIPSDLYNSVAQYDTLIPDGYKVTASFKSIVPNNYNTFAATATGRNIVPSFENEIRSQMKTFLDEVNANLKKIVDAPLKAETFEVYPDTTFQF